jgi:hypothetical protein
MRLGLLLSAVLFVLALVPTATANRPVREIIPGQDDLVITGQCAFPVRAHFEGREIHTTFTDRARDPVRLLGVFPGNMLTVTNLDTGRSITLPATGSFQLRLHSDGSASAKVTGHGPWFPNPVTGESGVWYQSGQVSAEFDGDGDMTSVRNTGTLEDLCPVLAS